MDLDNSLTRYSPSFRNQENSARRLMMNVLHTGLIFVLMYTAYLILEAGHTYQEAMVGASTGEAQAVAVELLQGSGLDIRSCKVLQSLWAGYGHICHITATSESNPSDEPVSLILKHINPPATRANGSLPNEGHIRKILSYQVEQFFYTRLAPQMPADIPVAKATASTSPGMKSSATAMLLSDLRISHPVAGEKRSVLTDTQTYAALEWLARFHGFWWAKASEFDRQQLCLPPLEHYRRYGDAAWNDNGVWLNGGYTYLSTRRAEYNSLANDPSSEWSSPFCSGSPSLAEVASVELSPENEANAEFVTLIHGDVKSENLFSSEDGTSVAFYDFQYVGLGLGVCDLAKLFTCSVPERLLPASRAMGTQELKLLQFYHGKLQEYSGKPYPWKTLIRHWETALLDWLRFQASWGSWGNTEWLEERGRGIIAERLLHG